jgi:hypothetical protein
MSLLGTTHGFRILLVPGSVDEIPERSIIWASKCSTSRRVELTVILDDMVKLLNGGLLTRRMSFSSPEKVCRAGTYGDLSRRG